MLITYSTADWIGEELEEAIYEKIEEINEQLSHWSNVRVRTRDGGGYNVLCDDPLGDEIVKGIEIYFEIVEDEDD